MSGFTNKNPFQNHSLQKKSANGCVCSEKSLGKFCMRTIDLAFEKINSFEN